MDIKGQVAMGPQRFHDARADGDVGYEMSIHHIDMDPIRPGRGHSTDFRAELGEVGGKD